MYIGQDPNNYLSNAKSFNNYLNEILFITVLDRCSAIFAAIFIRQNLFLICFPSPMMGIEIIYLSREFTLYNSRHPRHGAFWHNSSDTTYTV
jgi:hypothetical protein